jgi:peptide/nickel transport system ATP-binding protein
LPRVAQRKSKLPSIPGRVPSPDEMPAGCRFAPRCPFAEPQCGEPQALERSGSRHVRCNRYRALELAGATA